MMCEGALQVNHSPMCGLGFFSELLTLKLCITDKIEVNETHNINYEI